MPYVVYGIYQKGSLVYVGLTKRPLKREREHKRKFKGATFRRFVRCDRAYAQWLERKLIDLWRPKRNLNAGGSGPVTYRHSPEAKCRISEAVKVRVVTDDTRNKMSEAALRRPPVSEETRRKLRGYRHTEKAKICIGEKLRGVKKSLEARKNMSQSALKRPPRTHSDETRRHMSRAQKKRFNDPDAKRRHREGQRRRRTAEKERK
ncbi:hypothetical protein LCGC14_0252420 [marine sediment metagenome]|uniref:Nuclease associated modular domain-containing protein n=1 Tax=marine sediment metagenome TaxID=412755 RepID=A0A0F9U4K9_9ZZZZ